MKPFHSLLTVVVSLGAMPLLAGERSDAFVAAARKAYAADPMCRTTVVTNFVVKGTPDDKAPGLVRWYDVEGARNVRDIGGWTGLRAGRVFRGTELNSKPNHKQYELTERGRAVMRGEMGIVSDLDLRGEIAEYGEDAKTKSPIGEGSQLLSRPVSSYVETCTSPRSAKAFAEALRIFADEKNFLSPTFCALRGRGGSHRNGVLPFGGAVRRVARRCGNRIRAYELLAGRHAPPEQRDGASVRAHGAAHFDLPRRGVRR